MGALRAYSRSKLGNFWIARELQKRHPHFNVFIVHPGAVATDLRGNGRLAAWLNRFFAYRHCRSADIADVRSSARPVAWQLLSQYARRM